MEVQTPLSASCLQDVGNGKPGLGGRGAGMDVQTPLPASCVSDVGKGKPILGESVGRPKESWGNDNSSPSIGGQGGRDGGSDPYAGE